MSKKFYCPHCGGNLNPNSKVITVIVTETGKKGLALQSEEYGDYKYSTDSNFQIKENEVLTHSCPLCQSNLQSKKVPGCSELIVIEDNKKDTIFFVNNGKQATGVLHQNGQVNTFGKDRQSVFAGYDLHEFNYEDNNIAIRQ